MVKKVISSFALAFRSQPKRRIPHYHYLLAVVLIVMLGSFSFSKNNVLKRKTEAEYPHTIRRALLQSTEGMTVKYVEVPSGREDMKRYAALQKSTEEQPISIQSWMVLVASNSSLGIQAAHDLSDIISSSSYASLKLETPATSWQSSSDDKFEFVIVDTPELQTFAESSPDRYTFKKQFRKCKQVSTVCSFNNLGGDAMLVSPLPQTDVKDGTYSHLAIFLRDAPKDQVAEFWRSSAASHIDLLKQKHEQQGQGQWGTQAKTWFSTAGMGVAWLHLRLDSTPKYYSYVPFKS